MWAALLASNIGKTRTNVSWLYVNVLLDLNDDGDWEDEGEWAIQNMEVAVPMAQTAEFPTEVEFPEEIQLRMTLTGVPLEGYNGKGEFEIGETEDFKWSESIQYRIGG